MTYNPNVGRDPKGEFRWRTSRSIAGIQANLQGSINQSNDGATVYLDLATAKALVEICRQAKHTEVGHEPPAGSRG